MAAFFLRPHAKQPGGDTVTQFADISSVLFLGATVIFVAVVILIAVAIFAPRSLRDRLARPSLILLAGIAFPVVSLTALLVYALAIPFPTSSDAKPTIRVEVTGELWWWRVRYLDESGALLVETANEISIPSGQMVEFVLKSDNVIHSFWIPELGSKLDMIPGHVNRLRVREPAPGVLSGQCAEYCGAQHTKMKFAVHVLAPASFNAWLSAQRQPARMAGPELEQGAQRFQHACAACHTVRGTPAAGTSGPDLTHVASRSTLAAGVLTNNVGAMAGWIAASQHIKPGNRMPSFDQWSGEELRAVASYLDSLK